jgi:hypothetical protein
MAKKWIAINLLLLVIAGLLGWELRASILRFNDENNPAKIRPTRAAKPATIPPKPGASGKLEKGQAPEDFSIIMQKNIFSETRGNEEVVEAPRPPEPPKLTQKPILVGTIIFDNQYKALIIDPTSTTSGIRRPEIKRIGDVYRGFTITGIYADHIVLENGTRPEIIPLHEGTKKAQQGRTPIAATRVVAFGGGAMSGGAISATSARSAAPTRTPAPMPVNSIPPGSQVTITAPGGAPARTIIIPNQPQNQPQSPADTKQQVITQPSDSGTGTRVIRSPFGDIIRPN